MTQQVEIEATRYGPTPEVQIETLKMIVEQRRREREEAYAAQLKSTLAVPTRKSGEYNSRKETLQQAIMSCLDVPRSAPEIQNMLGLRRSPKNPKGIGSSLNALEKKGLVERGGKVPAVDKNGKGMMAVLVWRKVGHDG